MPAIRPATPGAESRRKSLISPGVSFGSDREIQNRKTPMTGRLSNRENFPETMVQRRTHDGNALKGCRARIELNLL